MRKTGIGLAACVSLFDASLAAPAYARLLPQLGETTQDLES
jgi:hypothetical protein